MKRFCIYFIIVFMGTLLIDMAYRPIYSMAVRKLAQSSVTSKGEYSYVLNKEQSDILILGSSRAQRHYNPRIFIDSLHKTCFNAGYPSAPIYIAYLNLLRGWENGKIETVILEIDPFELSEKWISEHFNTLIPFYWESRSVREVVDEVSIYGSRCEVLYLSSLYQSNSKFQILRELMNTESSSDSLHGFAPLENAIPFNKGDKWPDQISPKGMSYVDKIVRFCKDHQIQLMLVVSPTRHNLNGFDNFMDQYCKCKRPKFRGMTS